MGSITLFRVAWTYELKQACTVAGTTALHPTAVNWDCKSLYHMFKPQKVQ